MQYAYEKRINFFESARDYRSSEEIIGEGVKEFRKNVTLATKMGDRMPVDFVANLSMSLKKLQTDYIDIYSFQGINSLSQYTRYMEKLMPNMLKAKEEGLIDHIGITGHSIQTMEFAYQNPDIEYYFFPLNILTREANRRLIPLFKDSDKKLIAMKPFGGYKYLYAQGQDPKWIKGVRDLDRWFIPVIALKYLLQFPQITSILCGFENRREIYEDVDIYRSSSLPPTIGKLYKFKEEHEWCDECGACKCPKGIRIKHLMRIYDYYKYFGMKNWAKDAYRQMEADYGDCDKCGKCACPKNLPILECLAELDSYLG